MTGPCAQVRSKSVTLLPGITFCVGLAAISFVAWLSYKPISSLMWAFILSIIISNVVKLPDRFASGISFCARDLLRGAIAALGIVTSGLIWMQVGIGVINALVVIFFSYFFSIWLGRKLRISNALATLIGIGTCICGASAIAATGPAIGAKEEEMGLALACITLFGLFAMFAYPFLYVSTLVGKWLGSNLNAYSIWCGSGIHETAQVIAAAGALGAKAIGAALLVKSIRIFMIGPMVLVATYLFSRMEKNSVDRKVTKIVLPTYGIVFIINSLLCAFFDTYAPQFGPPELNWPVIKSTLSSTVLPFLLATAFAGVGSKVNFKAISKLGAKPFVVGALTAILAGILALALAIAVLPLVPPS